MGFRVNPDGYAIIPLPGAACTAAELSDFCESMLRQWQDLAGLDYTRLTLLSPTGATLDHCTKW